MNVIYPLIRDGITEYLIPLRNIAWIVVLEPLLTEPIASCIIFPERVSEQVCI